MCPKSLMVGVCTVLALLFCGAGTTAGAHIILAELVMSRQAHRYRRAIIGRLPSIAQIAPLLKHRFLNFLRYLSSADRFCFLRRCRVIFSPLHARERVPW